MHRYLVFASAALGLLMYSIDATAVSVAFPNFIREFHAPVMRAAWTISIYYIAMTMSLPLAGNLSDSFGRKRIFLVSLVLFTCSSLACGLSPNIYALIGFRFLQGVGGAAFLPVASGIVTEQFPENRERMIGLFTSIVPIGGIVGPNLGGWIVSSFSWRYIFYINLPIGALLTGMILSLLRASKPMSRPHVDLGGVFSMSGGILFLMFGLNIIGESFAGRSLLVAGVFLALSFAAFSLFFRHEKHEANPIMHLDLLKSTPFLAANILNLVIGAGVFGVFAFVPYYATSVHKLSTLLSGMILTPRSLGTIPASAVTAFLLRRVGYRRPIVGGLVLTACSVFLFAPGPFWDVMGARFSPAEILSFLILLSGIGMGVALPAANNACIELLPQKVGTIVGLRGMFRTIGGAVGVSLLTFILHLSGDPVRGFRLAFALSGIVIFCAIPLVFLMPAGRESWT
jgi:EmrB/QacA subfamily drug resistance transporter